MSGFCVLLVSVWLFDSDLRRWIFPALLGSGQAGTKCTPLWETSPRHFPSHLSSPAAPVLNGRAGLSPPPPSRRAPAFLRGCGDVRGSGTGSGGRARSLCQPEPEMSRVSRALPAGLTPGYSPPAAPSPATPSVRRGAAPRPAPRGGSRRPRH